MNVHGRIIDTAIIERVLPESQRILLYKHEEYPLRYTEEQYTKIINNNEKYHHKQLPNYSQYKLWKAGINPFTRHNIKIGGSTHKAVGKRINVTRILNLKVNTRAFTRESLDKYLQETKKIHDDIDAKNKLVDQHNKMAVRANRNLSARNKSISILHVLVGTFTKWHQYATFEGKYYGTDKTIINDRHIVDGCNGYVSVQLNDIKTATINVCEHCGII